MTTIDAHQHFWQYSAAEYGWIDDSMTPLRVLVVDDEQLARDELCFLLGEVGGVEILGQATDGIQALRMAGDLRPDLVFLDVQMPELDGLSATIRRGCGKGSIARSGTRCARRRRSS